MLDQCWPLGNFCVTGHSEGHRLGKSLGRRQHVRNEKVAFADGTLASRLVNATRALNDGVFSQSGIAPADAKKLFAILRELRKSEGDFA